MGEAEGPIGGRDTIGVERASKAKMIGGKRSEKVILSDVRLFREVIVKGT